jgi:hypothetical protein
MYINILVTFYIENIIYNKIMIISIISFQIIHRRYKKKKNQSLIFMYVIL